MRKDPQGQKRLADVIGAAVMVAKIATAEILNRRRLLCVAVFGATVAAVVPSVAAECGPLQSLTTIDTLAGPNGAMLVPVRLNDSPRVLVFDTGGAMSGISEPVANELSLRTYSSNTQLRSVTGATSDHRSASDHWPLGIEIRTPHNFARQESIRGQ